MKPNNLRNARTVMLLMAMAALMPFASSATATSDPLAPVTQVVEDATDGITVCQAEGCLIPEPCNPAGLEICYACPASGPCPPSPPPACSLSDIEDCVIPCDVIALGINGGPDVCDEVDDLTDCLRLVYPACKWECSLADTLYSCANQQCNNVVRMLPGDWGCTITDPCQNQDPGCNICYYVQCDLCLDSLGHWCPVDEVQEIVEECMTMYSPGPCITDCTGYTLVQCVDRACDRVAAALPPAISLSCEIQDPCGGMIESCQVCELINCEFVVCSDHVDVGQAECYGETDRTCAGQPYMSVVCVTLDLDPACAGASISFGLQGVAGVACLEQEGDTTCATVTAYVGFNQEGAAACSDGEATCAGTSSTFIAGGLNGACVVVADGCASVHVGRTQLGPYCVPVLDADGDRVPDEAEAQLCGRPFVHDAINNLGAAGHCDSSDDYAPPVYEQSVFVPTGIVPGADMDADGVPADATLTGYTVTASTGDDPVTYTPATMGPFAVDPDDNDRNTPVPHDDVEETWNTATGAVNDTWDTVTGTIDEVWDWLTGTIDETWDVVTATVDEVYDGVDGDGDGVADEAEPWVCQFENQNDPADGTCSEDLQDYTPPV